MSKGFFLCNSRTHKKFAHHIPVHEEKEQAENPSGDFEGVPVKISGFDTMNDDPFVLQTSG